MENIRKMQTADVIVIGGGVLGGAVAFYLAKQNAGRVIVLERHSVAQGNSSLAAGLLTRGRFKPYLIPMVLETYQAIQEIEVIIGSSLGMRQTGCLYAAFSPVHQKEVRELVSVSSQMGLRTEWLDIIEASRRVPWLKLPRRAIAAFMPEDGYIDGYSLASGYIKAAKRLGVEIHEHTEVLSICKTGQRVTGVKTTKGDFSASLVIDSAGVWAGMLAYELGIGFPMAPVRSHYWITVEYPLFSPLQPFVILPDARAYARPESHRLLFGFRETQSVAVSPRDLPKKMNGYVFTQDPHGWESFLDGVPEFSKFFPLIEEIKISTYIKGLSNYTPDGNFVLGALPSLDGFLAATGCAGAGIAMSGGIGRLVAELATGRTPFVDAAPHRIDRFGSIDPCDPAWLQRCADARSAKITG
jgi:4-methylaminobutanoate oxidase (formaldehyde-forming)